MRRLRRLRLANPQSILRRFCLRELCLDARCSSTLLSRNSDSSCTFTHPSVRTLRRFSKMCSRKCRSCFIAEYREQPDKTSSQHNNHMWIRNAECSPGVAPSFPNQFEGVVAGSPKNVKYECTVPTSMQSSTTQALLERLVTGGRCEAKGCCELAVWRVSFNGTVTHWCPEHTRTQMRNAGRWGDVSGPKTKDNRARKRVGEIR